MTDPLPPGDILARADALLSRCRNLNLKLATGESCTGGLIAAALTEIAGSSDVFERGFVTYSNDAKQELLAVPKETLDRHGAVSAETAEAMARGVLANSRADIAVSVTGIAGPGGATPTKPVGLVYIGFACREDLPGGVQNGHERHVFMGNRRKIRLASLEVAFETFERLAG